jgi:DNA repair protein RecN (Recombination protein N)
MLRTLTIRDYALIDELEVHFDAGLNVITGETGAGKSIVVGALKMILGERASTEVVRTGARKAVIEGEFDEAAIPAVVEKLEANEIEAGDHIILRREISSTQSRAFINDTPATVQLLKEVASNLIDLHGQHEHQSLLRTETHLPVIDVFGYLDGEKSAYSVAFEAVADLERERASLLRRERELTQKRDLYGFQIQEIDRVNPQADEDEALEAERRVLENAEHLFQSTAALADVLYTGDSAVHDALASARNELEDLARIDASFEESLSEMRSAEAIVSELGRMLQQYNARIEFNPERLEEIRERLVALDSLKRKYGGSLDLVLEHRAEIGREFELVQDFEGAISRLANRIEEAKVELSSRAVELSAARQKTAARVEEGIIRELGGLGMPDSRFEVRFTLEERTTGWVRLPDGRVVEASSDGVDRVEFYISTNVGEDLRPLARVASGGEISRIMLALKSILAKSERLPILVFDEIDTGISGRMARKVGESMKDLARFHQIIAITHLPQIAALGDVHFTVSKSVENGRTVSRMLRIDDSSKTDHIAALLAGGDITDASRQSARELMGGDTAP